MNNLRSIWSSEGFIRSVWKLLYSNFLIGLLGNNIQKWSYSTRVATQVNTKLCFMLYSHQRRITLMHSGTNCHLELHVGGNHSAKFSLNAHTEHGGPYSSYSQQHFVTTNNTRAQLYYIQLQAVKYTLS
jgi:hypothetical protein